MQLLDTPQLDQFREEVRDWLHANIPTEQRPPEGEAMRDFDRAWQRVQFDGGWAGIAWPKEYGGRGLSTIEQLIWIEEYARAHAPPNGSLFVALSHAGPTLIVRGNEAQKSFHLPRILNGESGWCQGFSESGAGSDLASLRTRGVIDGDYLVVTGQKIWTSYGNLSEWQELLIRTDPDSERHRGLTWVICDMTSPGITIRPIRAMSGLVHFCEVFYDEVRIPLSNVVGELGQGWSVAMTTLGFERGTGTIAHQIELAGRLDRLIAHARSLPDPLGSGKLIDDARIALELSQLSAEVRALRSLTEESVSRGLREEVPGAEGNIVALYFGELTRRVHAIAFDILGSAALERGGAEDWPLEYLEAYKWAIGGGTSEIRRNVIAERVLGLPREPRA